MEFKEAFHEIKQALNGARSDYEKEIARIDNDTARRVQQAQSLTGQKDELIKKRRELERLLEKIEPHASGYRRLQRAVPADMQRIRALWLQVDIENRSDSTAIEIAQMLYEGVNDIKRQLDEIDNSSARSEAMRMAQQMRKAAGESYEVACRRIIDSHQMQELAAAIRKYHALADITSLANGTAKIPQGEITAPFVKVQGALRAAPGCEAALSARLAPYSPDGTRVFLPQRAAQLTIVETTNQSETQSALAAMRTFAMSILLHMKPVIHRVTFLDAVRRDNQALGEFAFLGGKEGFCPAAPRTQAELTQALRMLWHLQDKKPEQRFLFVRGYPGGFDQEGQERIRQIIDARQDKRICVILIDESPTARRSHIEQSNPHVLRLVYEGEKLFRVSADGRRIPAEFYKGIDLVHPEAAKRFKAAYQQRKKNMLYTDYFNQTAPIHYRRNIGQAMSLPYGVDENGEVQYLTFENLDFSAYLLGQSGSGKSTLFHTLIAGIINRFHPDDAELWLADLGKTEFARYASHPLPHLRCLIIDDTQETITAFILRLEDELIRRQQLCLTHDALDYKDYVKKSGKPMPRAFVIIDEFGALSTIISQEDNPDSFKCRDALVRLLKEGRKMGFCFLFANQSYINGAKGLREEARSNVGQRLVMAAPKNEKNALLDIPSSMRGADYDAVVDSVRPHQLLVHCTANPGPFGPVNTLYLTEEHVAQRNALADELMKRLCCVSEASVSDPDSYTDKQPVIVNSIRPEKFSGRMEDMRAAIDAHRKDPVSESGDLLLFPGEPKDLSRVRKLVLSCDRTGNALLLASQEEISADRAGSVIRACCKSAQMQGVPVEIWAYRKSRFIAACQMEETQIHYESKWLCNRIEKLHTSLFVQQEDHRLIVLLEPEMMMEQLEDFCDCTPADMPPGDGSARDELDRLIGRMGSRKQNEGPTDMLCELVSTGAKKKGIHFLAVMKSDDGISACGFRSVSFGVQMAFRAGVAESRQFALQKAMRYVTKNTIFGVTTAGDKMLFSPFDW